jgi:hypothetical protein
VPLGCGLLPPLSSLRIVLRHAVPVVIQHSKVELRISVALFGLSIEIGNLEILSLFLFFIRITLFSFSDSCRRLTTTA